MRLARVGEPGNERPALLINDDEYIDIADEVGDFDRNFFAGDGIERLRELSRRSGGRARRSLADRRLGPPVARPSKLVCIGLNYADHAVEARTDVPSEPTVFFKDPNTIVGPNDDVLLPIGGEKTDWEVELAVVIGRTARYLSSVNTAMGHVAGYALSNDISERAFQLERGGQWVKGKSCETFNPLGPWLATPDEFADVQGLQMRLSVNGEVIQDSSTAQMVYSVAHIIWYLSQFMVLYPGDVINTGTPAGVGLGMDPPRYLAPADAMELSITGLGVPSRRVVDVA